MHSTSAIIKAFVVLAGFSAAAPAPWSVPPEHLEILALRRATPLNPDSVTDVRCWNTEEKIIFHEENAAQLAICDGISGSTSQCGGSPATTVGRKGSAKFTLTALRDGAKINISKVRWEECVHAARAVCPTGSLSATCRGGATVGDVAFVLENPALETKR